ncbi:hypothetical protein JFZ67_000831 [Salmonella enterica]|nr:hypothetical protein [Salmonella enterica]
MLACQRHLDDVFPAPAGINRAAGFRAPGVLGVPRASGDKPAVEVEVTVVVLCSPRQRG